MPEVAEDIMRTRVPEIVAILAAVLIAIPHTEAGQEPARAPLPGAPTADRAQDQLDFANGLYQRDMYLEAAEEYGTFVKTYRDHAEIPVALFRRAECLYQASYQTQTESRRKEILTEAEQDLRTLLERFPQNSRRTEALLRRGEILCWLERPAEATPLLEELLRGSLPETVEEAARFYLGQAYWNQKKTTSAEKQWETARGRFPKGELYAKTTYSLAILKRDKAQPKAAIALLKELVAARPRFPLPKESRIPGDARMLLAQIYSQQGDHAQAAAIYQEASGEPRHRVGALYGRAWALFQQEKHDETAAVCRDLLKERSVGEYEGVTLFLLGTALYETEKYRNAVDPLRRAVAHPRIAGYRTQAWYRLVWSLFLTDDHAAASQEANALLKLQLDPQIAGDVHFVLAQIAGAAKRYPQAAVEYRTLVEQFPASRFVEKAAYSVGDMEYRSRAYDRAARAFASFLTTYPKSALYDQALRWLAESLLQAGQYKEAADRINQLLERNPSHEDLPGLLYRQGLALYESGQTEEMRGPLTEFLKRFADSPHAPEALYLLAWQDDQAGNKERSLQEYERLVKEYPGAGRWWNAARLRLAVGYMKAERMDRALPLLMELFGEDEQAAKLGPEIFFRAAIYASEQGDHAQALRVLNRVAVVHPDKAVLERALVERGRELIALNRWQEASDDANQFLEKFPNSQFQPEAHWIRARALQGQNLFDDAWRAFEQSLDALSSTGSSDLLFEATLHLDRAKLLEVRGRPEEALKEYLFVDILFPDPRTSPQVLLRASICQEQLGKEEEARRLLERLVQTYGDTPEAKQARERLERLGPSAK